MVLTQSAQILLVARRDPQDPVRRILKGAGYAVVSADSPSAVLRTAERSHPSVIVVEPGALTMQLMDSLLSFASAKNIPVVREWPGPETLLSGIEQVLGKPGEATRSAEKLAVGPLSVDLTGHVATVAGLPLDLTAREFDLLCHLVRHPGWVYSRQELLEQVWGYEFGDPRVVTVHMANLRKKLDAASPGCELIETVRNVGYKLVAPGGQRQKAGSVAGQEVDASTDRTEPASEEPIPDAAIADERRLVTVLFAHVAGLGVLSEALDFGSLRELTDSLFDRLTPCIERYGGRVERRSADSFVALFGAPIAHDNDAEMAIRAAADIREAAEVFQMEKSGSGLSMHIGIDTGMAIAGSALSGDGRYSVVGGPVDTAIHLAGLAEAGQVLVGPDVLRLVAEVAGSRPAGTANVRGRADSVAYHQICHIESNRQQRAGGRWIESELVGREEPVALFRAALSRLHEGTGSVVFVSGEAGVGKSRLTAEVRREAEKCGLKWLEARTLSYGQNISYLPFREIVQIDCGIHVDDPPADRERKLRERVDRLFADKASEFLPILAGLLGIAHGQFGDYEPVWPEEEGLRKAVVDRAGRYARRLSTEQPLVITFEDVHWLDRSSFTLIESLMLLPAEAPMVVCLVGRGGPDSITLELLESAKRSGSPCVDIRLDPLTPQQTQQLVRNLLRGSEIEPLMMRVIESRSEGNPFFAEEIIRHLIDTGSLERDARGNWGVTNANVELSIPTTVHGVISARIDRLPGPTRQELLQASVLGRSFNRRLLRSLSSAEDSDFDEVLQTLQDQQLIFLKRQEPELEYAFKHTLVQEAAYGTLLRKQRRELHRRVAKAIEQLYSGQIRDLYGILAYHYTRAEDWQNAQSYLLKAGDQSVSLAADAEAVAYYRDAMSALLRAFDEISGTADSQDQVNWFVAAAEPFWLARSGGELLDSAQVFFDKILKACGPSDPRTMAATAVLAGCHLQRGAHGACVDLAQRALGLLQDCGREDDPSLTRLLLLLGLGLLQLDRYSESEQALTRALHLESAKESGDSGVFQDAYIYLSTDLFYLGRHDDMRRLIEEALDRFDLKGTQRGWMLLINLSSVNLLDGRWEEAATQARECVDGIVNPYLRASAARHLAEARFAQGAYLEAEEQLKYALGVFSTNGAPPRQIFEALTDLAETQLQAGKVGKAEETSRRVLSMMETTGALYCEAEALWTLAGVEMERGDLERADSLLEQSAGVVREKYSPRHPFCAEMCFRRAELRQTQGRAAEAGEDFEHAIALMTDLGGASHPRISQMKAEWAEKSIRAAGG